MSAPEQRPPRVRRAGSVWQYARLPVRTPSSPPAPPSDRPERPLPVRPTRAARPSRRESSGVWRGRIRAMARFLRERFRRGVEYARADRRRAVWVGGTTFAIALALYFFWHSFQLNMLVMGIDDSDGFRHTDTMMLVRYRPATESAALISVPRDTLVRLPDHPAAKINTVFMTGYHGTDRMRNGAEAARQAVETVIGEPVPYYVLMDYDSFAAVVDLLGGVEVQVDRPMHYDDWAGNLHIHFDVGKHWLEGQKALEYVRFRHDRLGDLGRIERQQAFVQAIAERLRAPRNILRLPWLLPALRAHVTTNLSLPWLMIGGLFGPWLSMEHVKHATLPGRPVMLSGQWMWLVDLKASAETLQALQSDLSNGVEPEPPHVRVQILNGSGISGAGQKIADRLRQEKNVVVADIGVLHKHMKVHHTQVIDRDGANHRAERIAQILRIHGKDITTALNANAPAQVIVVVGQDFEKHL